MYCKKCGTSIEEQDEFCTNCGTPVQKPNSISREKAKGRKWSLVIIISLFAIIGVGIGGYMRLSQKTSDVESAEDSKNTLDFRSNISKGDSKDVLLPILRNEKCGYINDQGKMVIEPKYDEAGAFDKNGLARVSSGEKWGYIDKAGNEVVPLEYDLISEFSVHGLAFVELDGKYGYVNMDGELVIPCYYDDAEWFADNGLALVMIEEKYGYINTEGETVIPCQYEEAGSFADNGMARVKKDEKYGYINQYGDVVIDIQYDDARDFYESKLAPVCENGKWGYIDKDGNEIVEMKYDAADSFTRGKAYVEINDKDMQGIIDESGSVICSFDEKYYGIDPFKNGLLRVGKDGNLGCLDENGEMVIDAIYFSIMDTKEGLMLGMKGEREVDLLDKNGNIVISVENGGIGEGAEGYYFAYECGLGQSIEVGYYNGKGEEIIPSQNTLDTNDLRELREYVQIEKKGENPDKKQLRFPFYRQYFKIGMMDGYGRIIVDAEYGSINFEDEDKGMFRV